ncbi:hypothetical protein TWF706_000703 [Orbilia oligospora]|uniref:C2H2-type domain-containing protein n=2 Tax=Orbilia oligospora TaxID=2813651 RepID=A0A7C8NT49_ORBOL|nr:hypothetical protein TWF706_000703 [Orbilia oligospora]KAF3126132.1 hypothetical protein TWF703_010593 [Orbilia oligospora]
MSIGGLTIGRSDQGGLDKSYRNLGEECWEYQTNVGGLDNLVDQTLGEGRHLHQLNASFEINGHYSPVTPPSSAFTSIISNEFHFLGDSQPPLETNSDNFDLVPQFTSQHQPDRYIIWPEYCTEGHQDGFSNRLDFFEQPIENSGARRLLGPDMKPPPTYPIASLIETAASPITPLNDNTPSPQIYSFPTYVTSNTFDISGGVVPSPPMASPTLSPTNSIFPFSNLNRHDGSPESQSELMNDETPKLKVTDVRDQIEEISPKEAMEHRSRRRAKEKTAKKAAKRSDKKMAADECRVEKNASGLKPRKDRTLKCPEPKCKSKPWSNKKKFQDHLAGHDIRCFVCKLCNKDFPRFDNAVGHLLKSKKPTHVGNRENLLAKKRFEKQLEINSQSSESPTPSFTSFEIPLPDPHPLKNVNQSTLSFPSASRSFLSSVVFPVSPSYHFENIEHFW